MMKKFFKGKAAQYAGGGGSMAAILIVFDQVNSIEGLTPNMELGAKGVIGLCAIGATVYLQSRKPPESLLKPQDPPKS
jgi:hypothetical protein